MTKIILYLDLDNTLFGFIEAIFIKYNAQYNDDLTINSLTNYDVTKHIKSECKHLFKEFANRDTFQIIKPYPGAVDAVEYLNSKYQVYYASSGHPYTQRFRDDLLMKWFPSYKSRQLIMIRNKGLLNGKLLIDDNVDNLMCGRYKKIVYDMPWNRYFTPKQEGFYDIKRVKGWNENTIKIIEELMYL